MIPFANGGEQYHRDSSYEWQAVLHTDESFPGSDIDLVNEATRDVLAIFLKATASPAWIKTALVRYPDIPLLTTDEVAAPFAGEPRVTGTGISNSELKEVTEENFGQLLDSATLPDPGQVAAPGGYRQRPRVPLTLYTGLSERADQR